MSKTQPIPLDRPEHAIEIKQQGGNTLIECWGCTNMRWVRTGSTCHHEGLCGNCINKRGLTGRYGYDKLQDLYREEKCQGGVPDRVGTLRGVFNILRSGLLGREARTKPRDRNNMRGYQR